MKNNVICLLVGIIILCSCKKKEEENISEISELDKVATINKSEYNVIEYGVRIFYLLDLINAMREKGCTCSDSQSSENMPPVPIIKVNETISKVAMDHTQKMWYNQKLSHGFNGETLKDRLLLAYYNPQSQGENVAAGYNSELEVVKGWLESKGHCKNIMSAKFTEMGAARIDHLWTLDLAKPK